jgi:hypothetical protein
VAKKHNAIKQCALCLKTKELRDSHLIPAGILGLLRDGTYKNPNPYLMSLDYFGQTSNQAKQFLLCHDCEQRLNQCGENWVINNAYHEHTRTFPLRDMLEGATPILAGPNGGSFNASEVRGIDVEKLTYFNASVIWRASLRSWIVQKQKYDQIQMEPEYQEQLRRYLLGEADFPEDAISVVYFSPAEIPALHALYPQVLEEQGYRNYRFYVPGIWFLIAIGDGLTDDIRKMCILRSSIHPINTLVQAENLIHAMGINMYFHHKNHF